MRFLVHVIFFISFVAHSQESTYEKEIEAFRKTRIDSLKHENGWLNLAGLFWLNEGVNTIGGDPKNDFVFPAEHADAFLGQVIKKGERIYYVTKKDTLQVYPYAEKPVIVAHQTLRWFVIKRGEKFAIRLRRPNVPRAPRCNMISAFRSRPWRASLNKNRPVLKRTTPEPRPSRSDIWAMATSIST